MARGQPLPTRSQLHQTADMAAQHSLLDAVSGMVEAGRMRGKVVLEGF